MGRKIAKEKVNYRKEIEKQLGSVVCINLQADEPKHNISIKRVLDAELAAAFIAFFSCFESCDFPRIMEGVCFLC